MSKMSDLMKAVQEDDYLPPLITPLHHEWVAAGAKYTQEAVDIITEQMRKDWLTDGRSDGSNRVRPSMIGGCLRKQRLSFLGADSIPPDARSLQFFTNGHFGHYRWQLAGLSAGWLTAIEVPVSTPYGLVGQADGECFDGSVFELKTTNGPNLTKVRGSNRPLAGHELQTAGYAESFGTRFVSIIYEGREWLDFHEIRFKVTDDMLDKVANLCVAVMDVENDIQPLDSCLSQTGNVYNGCEFRFSCRPMDYA